MSTQVFPTFPGLTWDIKRSAMNSTVMKSSPSGREFRVAMYSTPRYKYTLNYEVLRGGNAFTEWQQLVGFFNARAGSFDTFLLADPNDGSVSGQVFGAGDGVTTAFQLVRTLGGFVEPVYAVSGTPSISVAGVVKTAGTDYTISASGLVTFTAAPAAAAALTWTGNFYWVVRFDKDQLEVGQLMQQFFEARAVTLITVKP